MSCAGICNSETRLVPLYQDCVLNQGSAAAIIINNALAANKRAPLAGALARLGPFVDMSEWQGMLSYVQGRRPPGIQGVRALGLKPYSSKGRGACGIEVCTCHRYICWCRNGFHALIARPCAAAVDARSPTHTEICIPEQPLKTIIRGVSSVLRAVERGLKEYRRNIHVG